MQENLTKYKKGKLVYFSFFERIFVINDVRILSVGVKTKEIIAIILFSWVIKIKVEYNPLMIITVHNAMIIFFFIELFLHIFTIK